MIVILYHSVILSTIMGDTFTTGLSHSTTHKVCDDVWNTDELICQKIEKPSINYREKVFSDIQQYIKALESLHGVLKSKRDWILAICKDVFMLGNGRFMKIRFDQEYLLRGFNWTNKEMSKYLDLRDEVLDKWTEMEPDIQVEPTLKSKHWF